MINKRIFFFGNSPFKNYFFTEAACQTKFNFIESVPEVADVLVLFAPVTEKQSLVLNQIYAAMSTPVTVIKINRIFAPQFSKLSHDAVLPFKIDHEFSDDVSFDEFLTALIPGAKND